MSHFVSVTSLPADGEAFNASKAISWRTLCAAAGVIGFVASLVLFFLGGEAANAYAFSYLWAFEVFFTITCGALFWCLLHNASNSSWGVAIRRIPETLAQSFVFLFIMGLPLVLPFVGVGSKPHYITSMYEWIGIHQAVVNNPGGAVSSLQDALGANHDTILLYKKFPYLHIGWNALPGWDWRYIIYFLALGFIAKRLLSLSTEQDRTGDLAPTLRARFFSSGMLPVFAVCSTFASIDYIKSLNYTWFSTMFGVNIFAGSALSAMATVILVVGFLKKSGHLDHVVSMEHFHLMGKLMFAFTVFWAYIAFSQFFLIWYANIPEETQFYAIRNTGGWWYFSLALTFLHFLLPFLLLLRRNAKRELNFIMGMAAYTIAMHMLELYWMVLPERGRSLYDASSATNSFTFLRDIGFDAMAFVTFAGVFIFFLIRNLSKHSLYPCGDPRLEESVNVVS
jgi:hypothetical protein